MKPKLFLIFVICGIAFVTLPALLQSQTCGDRSSYPLAPELRNRTPDANGIIHVSYGFSDSLSDAEKSAVEKAIAQWNGFSSSTKVKLEPVAQGAIADLDFKQSDDPNKNGGCAAYQPSDARIFYSSGWQQRAQNSPDDGATVIAHEIGHYLGLGEAGTNPSQPTIMNNPVVGPNTTCQNATVPTTTVQPNDATAAGGL